MSILLLLLLVSFLIHSSRKADSPADGLIYTFNSAETGQTFNIISVFKLFDNYIAEAKTGSNPELSAIYQREVVEPVYSYCFQDAEFIHMVQSQLNEPPDRLKELKQLVDSMSADSINGVIREALLKSAALLPGEKEQNVCVFPSISSSASHMTTAGSGKIFVKYNWLYTDDTMRAGIAHEYHHSVWAEKYRSAGTYFRILDNIVFEGKAVLFEKLVYPDIDFSYVYPEYDKELWAKIEPYLRTFDVNKQSLILYGDGAEIPYAYGYSEGYKMVKSYLDLHPQASCEEWTGLSADVIFELGRYTEHYQ
ncbi:DUF2268 domain-containing putative Zn-dependent protease [Paenibacillus tengchongensis]|uniref:DUF2268 domain-containing putative Zn-dependent protease n=1 Tax=Paenibacillus tengchongensis TaxID=2608684 RepID=UPI001C9E7DE4|nr:DUF2268 domain-containing putative Zn-dependent protease [Paenibacillus tengchongensis]